MGWVGGWMGWMKADKETPEEAATRTKAEPDLGGWVGGWVGR